ncbi:MAG TPA: sulfotransferase domain-containing protein [Myxococcota bacterium]|nr:sulfotransferase domain-containing protein [Myxococcota bacterium]
MYVICAGMYRAGSTWQYNVVSRLVETLGVGRRIGFYDEGKELSTLPDPAPHELLVLKSHHRHPELTKWLREGRALGVYIFRDLRDVAFSFVHKSRNPFDHVVGEMRLLDDAIQNDECWRSQPRTLCQRYEEVIANPVLAILELAKHLGISCTAEVAESLAREYSFDANFARIRRVEEQFESLGLDPHDPKHANHHDDHTLLHWNHMREGRVGGWREEATPEQIVALLAACGDWLIRRGYEPDCRWAWGLEAASDADSERAEAAIRGLAQSHERDGSQILTLRAQLTELTARFHELHAVAVDLMQLRRLTPSNFGRALRLQTFFAKHPRVRALLRVIARR